jgi:UDP-N-acetylmuramate--alanine ligase
LSSKSKPKKILAVASSSPFKPATEPKPPLHFIGIGGSGMAALAELALHAGVAVQGSDQKDSEVLAKLRALGACIKHSHTAASLGDAATVVYSSAIKEDNVELQAARSKNLNILHRSDYLAWLMKDKSSITVAGTHGKTTTSAMIAHVLEALGQDPTVAIGGTMRRIASAARFGHGPHFVAEADESDGTFLKYKPFIGVLTNIDSDHMEFFKNQSTLEKAFTDYLRNIDADDGCAVVGWDNATSRRIGSEYQRRRLTYGFLIGSEIRAVSYTAKAGESLFNAVIEKDILSCRLKIPGRHNVMNALCALAVVRALELNVKQAAEALATFPGVGRRMELIHEEAGLKIFDDYAHNPGKIAALLMSIREAWPKANLHVVFQAHRYSRLETMYDEMLGAVDSADFVYVVPVFSAGETTEGDFSSEKLAASIRARPLLNEKRRVVIACTSLAAATNAVREYLRSSAATPAVVLTVGAGDVYKVAEELRLAGNLVN